MDPALPSPSRPRRSRLGPSAFGALLIIGSAVLFGINGTVSKLALRTGLEATQLTQLRATGAFLGLLLMCLIIAPSQLTIRLRELPLLITYGLAGSFLTPLLYFVAIGRLPVGIALLFEYTAPVMVALWARFGQRQPVLPRLWGGLALCLCGLSFVAEAWGDARLDSLGVAAGLGAAATLALYYIVGAQAAGQRDPLSLMCWAFGVAAVASAVAWPWWDFPLTVLTQTDASGFPVWTLILAVVVFGTILPYVMIAAALRYLPATSASILGTLEPVLASAVAWAALNEVLSASQLLGGVIVLVGVVLAETARITPSTASGAPSPPAASEPGGSTLEPNKPDKEATHLP
mgnify:CR=1 FL=1